MSMFSGVGVSVFGLRRAGALDTNVQMFAKRSAAFSAAAAQLGGAVLLVWRTAAGLSSSVVFGSGGRAGDAASTAAVHLAQAVGAEARVVDGVDGGWVLGDELPDAAAGRVAWLRFRPGDPASRDSQQGADPAEVSRLVARSMSEGMWAAVLLRPASARERRSHLRWLEFRMQTRNPVHHSMSTDAVVVSVVAGGGDAHRLRGFLASLAAGLPGLDLAAEVSVDSLVSVRVRRAAAAVAGLGCGAVLGVFAGRFAEGLQRSLAGWAVAGGDPSWVVVFHTVAALLGVLGLWQLWRLVAEWVLGRASGWTDRLLYAIGSNRWPLPAHRWLPVRAPRQEKLRIVDGVERVTAASSGDYPLPVRSALVGAEVVAGLVAPQSGALHASGGDVREVPPQVLAPVGPAVGSTSAGVVHLPASDAPMGLAVTGGPGTGKTKLVTALWATDACDRAQPSGREGMIGSSNSMVFFDSKGDEVATLRRWAAVAGDRVVVVDVGDESTVAIDFFDQSGSASERAGLFLNAMVFAFGQSSIQGRSQEVLDAVLTGALVVDADVVAAAVAHGGLGAGVDVASLSPVQLAHILCGGRGDQAGVALYAGIAGEATRRGGKDPVGAQDLLEAAGKLAVIYQGPSESARRSLTEAARNKLNQLVSVPFWWAPGRRRVSWTRVLEDHLSVVVNLGRSATGRVVDDEVAGVLSSMMFYLLRNAIQKTCSGWQQHGRAVSIYSDELALIAGHSEGVMEWLRDQGRSYGVRLRLATQRPSQLPDKVRQAFLTMAALVSFKQEEVGAAADVAAQLGMRQGEWGPEDVLTLQPFTAAARLHVGMARMSAFVMRVPLFEGDMSASVTGWGYVPAGAGVGSVPGPAAVSVFADAGDVADMPDVPVVSSSPTPPAPVVEGDADVDDVLAEAVLVDDAAVSDGQGGLTALVYGHAGAAAVPSRRPQRVTAPVVGAEDDGGWGL